MIQPTLQNQALLDVLTSYRELAQSKREMGDAFERLIASFLVTDPMYAARFSDVWLWSEWPDRGKQPDTGIDLVARERDTNDYCAIQCKFYLPEHVLQKADIDSFFTASGKAFPTREGKATFTSRIIISTTDRWSRHAEEALRDQQIPTTRLGIRDLEDSPIDWSAFTLRKPGKLKLRRKKSPRDHQKAAIGATQEGFKTHDRGKVIMACGTGKTYTSLKLAEERVEQDGMVLFLVPSISLLSQTLREWATEADEPLRAFAVCSDTRVGRKREDMSVHDLAINATTNAKRLAAAIEARPKGGKRMTVVFSTYHSIAVLSEAQKKHKLAAFDLVICDEAHRTTGVTLAGEDESAFVSVHDTDFLAADKRLYMTATPRIYDDGSKSKAEDAGAEIASMDDESVFGPEFYRLGFGEAVNLGLLSDYKVMVLAVDEGAVSKTFQKQLADADSELTLEDAVKITGCWNGLAKRAGAGNDGFAGDPLPMRRAVAFARDIKSSKLLANRFEGMVETYITEHGDDERLLRCQAQHVDGTFNALERDECLDWLKADTRAQGNVCRILSNARCLSEGVDVPALDAVLFLNPRNSVVDVVQAVGRVMRRAEGKQYGYIILPIGVPPDVAPEDALKNNKRYKVVWQVLQALRAHDDRFNALINKIELNNRRDEHLQVIGVGAGPGSGDGGDSKGEDQTPTQTRFDFPGLDEWRDAIYARIVLKCGDRRYWESWAKDVADIAGNHTTRIKALLDGSDPKRTKAFERFMKGLHKSINPSIGRDEAIDMLSQHLITLPVFDALFEGYSFAKSNPISRSMERMIKALNDQALDKETRKLDRFYASVRRRADGIDNAEGKQKIILELYDKFFRLAFPKMTDKLGIVYTPVEVVDFINRSVARVLEHHFDARLGDEGVHVLDPFTGTGTFIVRMLQSGLLKPAEARRKYNVELHANEIVLLAYYIAAINIEEAYHDLAGGDFVPFEGIVLTDTFQMSESEGQLEEIFPENNERATRQRKQDIRVIVGNPPYSVGQGSENDDNQNQKYPKLDGRIEATYASKTTAKTKKGLYDAYIRAFRWASDRIQDEGVVGFVTNGGWLESQSGQGFRACLFDEFSDVYVVDLRGNARTQGERRKQEGGNIFAGGSRAPITITLLVRTKGHEGKAQIHYHDIGDYLSRDEKLEQITDAAYITGLQWEPIKPNRKHDWLNQRREDYTTLVPFNDDPKAIFTLRSNGVVTNRDAWAYNFACPELESNMRQMIDAYNESTRRYQKRATSTASKPPAIEKVINSDPKAISWSRGLKQKAKRGDHEEFNNDAPRRAMYRPFMKQWLYFDRPFNEVVYKQPNLFPTTQHPNRAIQITGAGEATQFSCLMVDVVPNLHTVAGGLCFPRYHYEKPDPDASGEMFAAEADADGYVRHDAITDQSLALFRAHYKNKRISKDDIFNYCYGALHSPEYRKRYKANLSRELPRVPMAPDFKAFARAGKKLAKLHLEYENVKPWPVTENKSTLDIDPESDYRVEKMRFGRGPDKDKDKTIIVYNNRVTLTDIPLEAHEYVVNGKSAIEWVMDRYRIRKDKASGIVNDPNTWSPTEPRYILDLLKRMVTVSMETMTIVKALPTIGAAGATTNQGKKDG